MLKLGSQALGRNINSILQEISIGDNDQYEWNIKLYHSTGGLKKDWYLGQDSCPVSKLVFELNEKICGAGTIEFAFLDFPIDADDYLEVRYNGALKYRALVDVSVDPKGGSSKLVPYSSRLSELLVNYTYTSKTAYEMLVDIISNTKTDTNISYSQFLIDTGDTATYTLDYSGYETPKKIIDDIVKNLDNRSWGVRADNIFVVYEPNSTTTQVLLYGFDPAYSELDNTKDYTKVKATRYQVFKKNAASGDVSRIGEVGYGGSYPTLEIENYTRKKEIKYTASEEIATDSEALSIAYNNLITSAVYPETTKIKDLRVDKYFPVIGEKIKVQDKIEYIQKTIINCESLTNDSNAFQNVGNWNGVTLDNTNYIEGLNSITFDNSGSESIWFDFGQVIDFYHPTKIGFMIYSNRANSDLQFYLLGNTGYSDGLFSDGLYSDSDYGILGIYNVDIPNSRSWYYKEFDLTYSNMKKILFTFLGNDSNSITINIDRIQLYIPHQPIYEQNIVKANFTITKDGTDCDVELNQYELQVTQSTQTLLSDVEKLKTVTQV